MATKRSPFRARFLRWLRPDAQVRRLAPVLIFMMAPWVLLAIFGTNRFVHCHHYPNITRQNGIETHTCLDPKWEIACSNRIKSDTVDTCLRSPFGWGITLIRHDKDTLLQECRKNKGPEAYIDGSNGCVCFIPLDQYGRCTTTTEHCHTRFGSGAIADVTTNRDDALLVLVANEALNSEEQRYLICRCAEGLQFDAETSRCR